MRDDWRPVVTLSTAPTRVLLVDDDPHLLVAVQKALTLKGFEVRTSQNAGEALRVIEEGWQEVIVLDVMMPVLDGLSLCKLLRDRIDSPILLLTALESVEDRVQGLEAGADDYLTKPFATSELAARISALQRRTNRRLQSEDLLSYHGLKLNINRWEATRDGFSLNLTSREFRILEVLMQSPEQVLSRERILRAIWPRGDEIESNVVDVHIASLRHKLEASGRSRMIQTIRGVGYALRE